MISGVSGFSCAYQSKMRGKIKTCFPYAHSLAEPLITVLDEFPPVVPKFRHSNHDSEKPNREQVGKDLKTFTQKLDCPVFFARAQHSERFPKRQLAHDIETEQIELFRNVYRFAPKSTDLVY